MAFNRPTLDELVTRIKSDFSSRLLGGATILRRSVMAVLARTFAGAVHLLYGYLDWIAKQAMPDTAEAEQLRRWASIWGITPTPAEFAQGDVVFSGSDGIVIPEGTELQRSDGLLYTTDADGTIASGTVTIAVTASESGADYNTDPETELSLTSPIAGVTAIAVADDGVGIDGGLAEEADEDLLVRLLARIQDPPAGGSEADYIAWAKEVAGVTRAWCYPSYTGPGTVGLTFVRDNDSGSIIPSGGEVTEVQDHIDALRPVTADLTVFAPVGVPLNFTILVSPNTTAVKAAVQAELEELILRETEPGGTLLLSHIEEAISRASGETDHNLTAPAADVTVATGEITTMGTITWL